MKEKDARDVHKSLSALLHESADHGEFFAGVVEFVCSYAEMQRAHPLAERLASTFCRAQLAETHAGVLHDLGGFLQSILFSSEVLVDSIADLGEKASSETRPLLEQAGQAAAAIQESARTGADVLRGIAGLGGSAGQQPTRVPLAWALASTIGLLRWPRLQIEMPSQTPNVEIEVPLGFFRRVLLNIVANAAEAVAGRENPRVWLTTELSQKSIAISVHDNGVGVAPESFRELFRPGYTTKKSGSGLGLFVCRQLLATMGGEITLTSRAGGPTTVTFTLATLDPT